MIVKTISVFGTERQREVIKRKNRGLIRRVARQLGVSHVVVSKEFNGIEKSQRVREALMRELAASNR